jgi:hypothetical protein
MRYAISIPNFGDWADPRTMVALARGRGGGRLGRLLPVGPRSLQRHAAAGGSTAAMNTVDDWSPHGTTGHDVVEVCGRWELKPGTDRQPGCPCHQVGIRPRNGRYSHPTPIP